MSLFLTPAELRDLTGRKAHRLQLAWLRDHDWPHEVDAAGRPRVLRAEFERRLSSQPPARQTQSPRLELIR